MIGEENRSTEFEQKITKRTKARRKFPSQSSLQSSFLGARTLCALCPNSVNSVLPSESEFPFWIDGSKLAFIGVILFKIRRSIPSILDSLILNFFPSSSSLSPGSSDSFSGGSAVLGPPCPLLGVRRPKMATSRISYPFFLQSFIKIRIGVSICI